MAKNKQHIAEPADAVPAVQEQQMLIHPSVLAAADAERKRAEEREKEEKFGRLVQLVEQVEAEIDAQAYKLKSAKGQRKGLVEECGRLGFSKADVESLLAERRVPLSLFDTQLKERRARMERLHGIMQKVGVKRVGEFTTEDAEYQRALNWVLNNRGGGLYVGMMQQEMAVSFSEAHALMAKLQENGVLSAPDDAGARDVIWLDR